MILKINISNKGKAFIRRGGGGIGVDYRKNAVVLISILLKIIRF